MKFLIESLLVYDHSCSSSCTNFAMITMVGAGGLGKTTLAQVVFQDQRVKGHFDLCCWVYMRVWWFECGHHGKSAPRRHYFGGVPFRLEWWITDAPGHKSTAWSETSNCVGWFVDSQKLGLTRGDDLYFPCRQMQSSCNYNWSGCCKIIESISVVYVGTFGFWTLLGLI